MLADVTFPLGDMTKEHVRHLAVQRGIPSALRRSSAGICFIGARLPIAMTPLYCGSSLELQLYICDVVVYAVYIYDTYIYCCEINDDRLHA
jgi:hypothetical protein